MSTDSDKDDSYNDSAVVGSKSSEEIQLDLDYITDRIIIMGDFYHNDTLNLIRNHLNQHHYDHYRIFNLSPEPEYNIEQDVENVKNYPFNEHNPCALHIIIQFCEEVNNYLKISSRNTIVIFSKTGKYSPYSIPTYTTSIIVIHHNHHHHHHQPDTLVTLHLFSLIGMGQSCMLAACFLLHCSAFTDSDQAIKLINERRRRSNDNVINNNHHNVLLLPSQIRYVHYYEMLLRTDQVRCKTYRIISITCITIPHTSSCIVNGGCTPHISLSVLSHNDDEEIQNAWFPKRIFNQLSWTKKKPLVRYIVGQDDKMDFDMQSYEVNVRGDVCLSMFSEGEKIAQLYFNTCFVNDNSCLVFNKECIDIANYDVHHYTYDEDFKIIIHLKQIKDDPLINHYSKLAPNVEPIYNRDQYRQKESELNDLLFMYSYGDTNIV